MKYFFLAVFGIIFTGVLIPHQAEAAGGFTVEPVFQEIILTEEGEKEFLVRVTNETETLATLQLSVLDFGSLDESGGVAFLGAPTELERKYSLASWMKPETDTLTLLPGGVGEVRVTVLNRPDLSPGGHYAALVFSQGGGLEGGREGSQIAVNQLFSVLVFVHKKGGELSGLELIEKNWEHHSFGFDDRVRLRFKNTGNVHLVPRGLVTLTDPVGRVVVEGVINEESALILPESFRVYSTRLVPRSLVYLPGTYTLRIAWRYEGREVFTVLEERLMLFPLPAILILLPVIVGAGWYVARKRKNTGGNTASTSGTF